MLIFHRFYKHFRDSRVDPGGIEDEPKTEKISGQFEGFWTPDPQRVIGVASKAGALNVSGRKIGQDMEGWRGATECNKDISPHPLISCPTKLIPP